MEDSLPILSCMQGSCKGIPENWGRWTHFDEHIFQMGWLNRQLETGAGSPNEVPPIPLGGGNKHIQT